MFSILKKGKEQKKPIVEELKAFVSGKVIQVECRNLCIKRHLDE